MFLNFLLLINSSDPMITSKFCVKSYNVIQNGLDFHFKYAGEYDLDFMVIDHHRCFTFFFCVKILP